MSINAIIYISKNYKLIYSSVAYEFGPCVILLFENATNTCTWANFWFSSNALGSAGLFCHTHKYPISLAKGPFLWGMELKFIMGVGDEPTRFEGIFSKRPDQRSKVSQRSICFRNALWPPDLVGRTTDRITGVKCHARVNWDQPGVKWQNCPAMLWLSNLLGRILDLSVVHWWGRRSCRREICPGISYGYQIW